MLLPNAERAFVDTRKLVDYALLADHPVGGHKAALLKRVLGVTAADADVLCQILLYVARRAETTVGRSDEFGQRYSIDFTLATPSGSATIRSAWIVRTGEDFPRLTTCFVLPR